MHKSRPLTEKESIMFVNTISSKGVNMPFPIAPNTDMNIINKSNFVANLNLKLKL